MYLTYLIYLPIYSTYLIHLSTCCLIYLTYLLTRYLIYLIYILFNLLYILFNLFDILFNLFDIYFDLVDFSFDLLFDSSFDLFDSFVRHLLIYLIHLLTYYIFDLLDLPSDLFHLSDSSFDLLFDSFDSSFDLFDLSLALLRAPRLSVLQAPPHAACLPTNSASRGCPVKVGSWRGIETHLTAETDPRFWKPEPRIFDARRKDISLSPPARLPPDTLVAIKSARKNAVPLSVAVQRLEIKKPASGSARVLRWWKRNRRSSERVLHAARIVRNDRARPTLSSRLSLPAFDRRSTPLSISSECFHSRRRGASTGFIIAPSQPATPRSRARNVIVRR